MAPLPLLAVAAMAANDFWLKRAAPGLVSGKLSDVAICFFLPLYISALLGLVHPGHMRVRVLAGAVVTAALYSALNVSQPVADVFARLLTWLGRPLGLPPSRAIADAGDLLVLPVVLLSVWYGVTRRHPTLTSST